MKKRILFSFRQKYEELSFLLLFRLARAKGDPGGAREKITLKKQTKERCLNFDHRAYYCNIFNITTNNTGMIINCILLISVALLL